MPFEPINPLGGFTGLLEPREPPRFSDENPETRPFQPPAVDESIWKSAFRTENVVGSSIASEEVREAREQVGTFGGSVKIDPDFDPWAEIAGTAYEPYVDQFARAGNKEHFEAIKADIDRENKDRDVIARSGLAGIGASMAAGTLDLPILIPGGAIMRTASGGVSLLRTAATTATAGTVAAIASEAALHGSQQLRTGTESAVVIGGSTVLAGLLGAGFGKLFKNADLARLAEQVEKDFRVPGLDEADPFSPGGFRVEAAPGASPKAQEVAAAIRETAEQILPPSVRVQVVDEIEAALGGRFARVSKPEPFIAPDVVAVDDIPSALKVIRDEVAAFDVSLARTRGADAPDLPRRIVAYRQDEAELRSRLIAGMDEVAARSAYAKLKSQGEAIVDEMRTIDARINRAIDKDRRARSGEARSDDDSTPRFSLKSAPQTPEFKRWFGKSQVTGKGGVPLRVYHGTKGDFDTFSLDAVRETGEPDEAFFFSSSPRLASDYAAPAWNPDAGNVMATYLKMENPLRIKQETWGHRTENAELIAKAKADGHDGIIFKFDDGLEEFVVWDPKQIKSAIGNRGTFDPSDARIQYSLRGDKTETSEFKRWFGDSKLVDENGKPLVLYHGTKGDVEAFDPKMAGSSDPGVVGKAFYFTPSSEQASSFAESALYGAKKGAAPNVVPVFVRVENPLEVVDGFLPDGRSLSDIHPGGLTPKTAAAFQREVKKSGHDGVIFRMGGEITQAAAFEPTQVKSAIGNRGTFDPNDPSIVNSLREAAEGIVAEGRFDPEQALIQISASALDPTKTLRHEAVHALRTLKLFTDKEWKTLEAAAKKQGWMESHNVRQLYEGVYAGKSADEIGDVLTEEAIAEQFSLWKQGASKVTGTVAKLFQRMKDFIDSIGNAMKGLGFKTADDVFAAIEGGKIAAREAGILPGLPGAASGLSRAGSVGAAARDSVDNTLKSAFGLEKAAAFAVPELRLFTSPSDVTKRYAQETFESALTWTKNKAGNETAPLGTELGSPGAVETRVKFWSAPLAEAVQAVDNAFLMYRKGRQKRMVGELSATTLKDTIFGTNALTYRSFKEEISKAMRRDDVHDIPEVAQVAKFIRKTVLDPLRDEAIATKLLDEIFADMPPETAASYLNRIYNRERIIAERDQFKTVVRDWLEETETHNAAVRARLSTALDELKTHQNTIKKAEEKAAKRKASGKEGDDLKAQAEIEEANLAIKDLEKAIEDEVVKYQGKSAKEAQRAVETRTEAEVTRDPNAKRLKAADKPVLRAAKKIAAQADKETAELDDLADQIIDRILGTPDGRLPYDAHMDTKVVNGVSQSARGPLAARVFMIPDKLIEPWLENDIDALLRSYVRTMAPDIELTKRFGSPEMTLQMKEITEDYAKRSAAAKTPDERKKIHKQRDADIRDLAAVRDRLRGTFALPSNPDALMVRAGRVVGAWNFMRMLGGMTVSAIPDLARPVMVHGMMRTFGDGLFPLMTNWSNAKLAMQEVKLAGTALDMVLDSRAMRIADVMDEFGRHTKFERAVHSGARNFGVVSLMAPWNAAMKQWVGLITMSRILKATDALARAKIKPKDMEALTAGGISTGNAIKIAEQMKKYGAKQGTVWMPNTHLWDVDAKAAKEAFRAALVRDVDRIVVTPGIADRPLWMSTEMGRLIGQFKSFALASMQKTTISGLQQADAGVLAGAALMIGLGGLVHVIKARGGDHDPGIPKRWGMNDETSQFMVNAVDRSGLLGWVMEVNNMSEKVSRGTVGLSALTGKQVGRYASRNITASMLGPSVGTVEDFIRITGAGISGEWNQTDSRTMKRLLPYGNLFYLRSAFDNAQKGIDEYFGVPERTPRN